MNIFKKQKFSIRKFTVGTFSTVIATLAFITHSGHAQAAEDVHQPNVADKQTVGANQTEGTPNSNASVTTTLNDSTTNQANNLVAANSSETTASINDHTTQPSKQEEKHETTQSKPLTVVNNQPSGTDRSIGEDRASNSNESEGDPMALNEQNTSGIINGDFEDTSNGASIPTNETEAAMNSATTVTGWHVKDSAQTEIPLVWGPKALSTYNGQTFNLTTHKIGAVLSKSTDNSNANQRVPQVGPIYQDIDVTPGSEVQLNFIGQSMGNTNGLNGVKVYIYDANNPTDLLYKGAPSTHNFAFGKFTGVFNVPDDVTKLRIMFESADGRSHDTYNGHRLLKGANNFGGGVVADVSLNSGSYLKTVNTTNDYKEVVTTDHETTVESTVNVDLENKGHSRAQNAVYKVTLPEGADYVSVFNANGSYDSATRVLSLSLGYIRPEEIRHFSYTVRLDATRPLRKEFNSTFTYNTEGLYMNKRDFRGDIGNNNFEGYRQFGGVNEFVKETTPRHEGNGTGEVQSITVKMFKNDLQAKVNKLEQLNEADYTPEVWAEMKEVLTHAKAILAETDDTPLDERKDQAEINATTLNLAKQADILAMDKVVVEKYAIIKNNAEFTVEERVNNRKKIKDFFDAAKGIIVNANNTTKADDAMNNGLRNINGVELVPIKKSYTKLEIDGILMTKEGEIDQVQDATDEEKAEARTQAEAAAQKGKSTIDRVPTNGEVDDAKNLAETEINAVQVAVVKKPTARQTLEHVASTKKATIDQTPDATQEEKDAAKGMVDDALRAAKEQIDQVTSNSQVDDAVTQGTTNINEVVAIVIKKNDARQTIDGTATTKKESLQQTPDATQEEIDVAKAKVDVAVNDAKANINSANTNGEVDTASNNGVDTINAIQVEVAKKSQARQAIDDAATAKKATIDQTPDATQEEKDAAKQKVDAAVTEAKANISTAVTNSNVDTASTNGVNNINAITVEVVKKSQARQAIDDAATAKKATIDQTPDATQEEKDAAKQKVDAAVTEAKGNIDRATTNNDVDTANTNGVNNINAITVDVVKKAQARQAIDDAATAKKATIDQTPDATQEEKDAAKQKVDQAVTEAKANISTAVTNSNVDTASTNGVSTINAVTVEVVKKSQARQAIDDAATAKKATIDQTPDATQEEKDAAKQKVDAAVTEAKGNIDRATTNNDVDTANTNGVNNINAVTVDVVKKAQARQAIDDAATAKKATIDQTPDATQEEKDAAKQKVDAAVTEAKGNIDRATTNNDVDTANTNGVNNVNAVTVDVLKKVQAKQAIDDAATAKKAIIDQTPDATQEEKDAAKQKVDQAVTEVKDNINHTNTNGEVDTANTNGVNNINAVTVDVVKKAQARQAIDDAATAKKATIDQTPDATQEEKDAAKQKVDAAVTEAKGNIDRATTNNDVDTANTNGVNNINAVTVDVVKKAQARQAIDDAATAKKATIDQTPDATQEEKDAAKQKVDQAVTEAKGNIDRATTNGEVDTANNNGVSTINAVTVDVVKKAQARQAIDDAATAKKATIDQTPGATKEEKDVAKDKVDVAVTEAKGNIDHANTNGEVDTANTNGTDTINGIQVEIAKKPIANKSIDDVVVAKKALIDQTPDATKEEKDVAKNKVDEEANKAKQNIERAITNNDVDTETTNGTNAINAVQVEVVKKAQARQAIDDTVTSKKAEIDKNIDATKEEKDAAKTKVDEAANKAKQAIDQATDNSGVDTNKTTGINEITNIQPETVKKTAAKQTIDNVAKTKKEQADQTLNATKEEKDTAKNKVDEEVSKAKSEIDNAETNSQVDDVTTKHSDTIKAIQVDVVKKDSNKKIIDEVAAAKKAEIDKNDNATKEEKDKAKQKIDEIVSNAKKEIDNQTTNGDVDKVTVKFTGLIKNSDSDITKKSTAKDKIEQVGKDKKAEIDQHSTATKEEKDIAKKAVDNVINKAKEEIQKSTTNQQVDDVTAKFTKDAKEIQVHAVKKAKALEELMKKAAEQKAKIDSIRNVSENKKAEAKRKIDTIVEEAKRIFEKDIINSDVDNTLDKAIEEILKVVVKPDESTGYSYDVGNPTINITDNSNHILNRKHILPNTGMTEGYRLPLTEIIFISGLVLFLTTRRKEQE